MAVRVRRAAALLLAAALTACGSDDAGDADPVTTTTAAEPTTTTAEPTTTTATTTFAQADDPPPLVNTGEDFDAIVRSFVAYISWVGAHPDADALAEVVRPDSPLWRELQPAVQELVEARLRDSGEAPAEVSDLRLLERPNPDLALVYVVLVNPAYSLVDEAGSVAASVAAEPPTAWAYELRREESRWRFEDRTLLGEP